MPHLERYFNDFMVAQTFSCAFDFAGMPNKWQQAMAVLSGARLFRELRALEAAASLVEWK